MKAPYIKGLPLVGHLFTYQRDKLSFLMKMTAKHGGCFRLKIGPHTLHIIDDTELIQEIMVKQTDTFIKVSNMKRLFQNGLGFTNKDEWRKQRKVLQPLFSPKYIDESIIPIRNVIEDRFKELDVNSSRSIDLEPFFYDIAFDVILKTIIGLEFKGQLVKLRNSLRYMFSHLTTAKYSFIPFVKNKAEKRFLEARSFVNRTIDQALEKATDSDINFSQSLAGKMIGTMGMGKLEDDKNHLIRNNIIGMMVAGFDTTALSLGWLCHCLSEDRALQERLYKEIKDFSFDDKCAKQIHDLEFLDSIIKEMMRLYPVGWAWTRQAEKDTEIGSFSIQSGEAVLISPYLTHRNPKYWKNPNQFDPSRFPENNRNIAYIPFGAGPRLCIGKNLGLLEMKMIAIKLLQSFKVSKSQAPPVPFPEATLGSSNGFNFILSNR